MDTVRVDICYRPLRIAWAIRIGDIDAFRRAARMSYALWGGRFNPIVVVDHEEEADRLIDLFRVDHIVPVGDSEPLKEFKKHHSHLIAPFFPDGIFFAGDRERRERPFSQVLDMYNALVHLRDTAELKTIKNAGVRLYNWQPDDPLADVFLVQFGLYPSVDEVGTDYRLMLSNATEAQESAIDPEAPIPVDAADHPTIASLSRHGLKRHYSVEAGWDSPGFFVGEATNLDDLVCHWNLRAADIPLWFVDPKRLDRYSDLITAWNNRMREMVSGGREFDRRVAVWSRCEDIEDIEEARKPFGKLELLGCPVSIHSWNGHNVRPPMMYFDEVSTLGVMGRENGKPKVSFALNSKPFCGDSWFHTQHLVASISCMGGLYGDEQHTLRPPFIPELNEFYARQMCISYNELRIEGQSIALIIDAADTDKFIYALPVSDLTERVFGMAGLLSKPSTGGLIVRQLIAKLGGLWGGRVFKIPGVRRLLKTHGPTAAFTKNSALQLIAGKDPDNPNAKFDDHRDLFIEPRPWETKLQPNDVFSHLVEKGLFRVGVELMCPSCRMPSWTALDLLKQRIACDLCGDEYDATRQLVNSEWRYRRSGLMGAERNAQGSVPVALTLQQLDTNLSASFHEHIYSPSLDLSPRNGVDLPACEVDFVWFIGRPYPRKTAVILGECKDQGPIKLKDFQKDVDNLRLIADALPRKRFKVFILLAKLSPFTEEEVECAKTLNSKHEQRVILLTDRELEPYHVYERTKLEFKIQEYASTPEDLATTTAAMYFRTDGSGDA